MANKIQLKRGLKSKLPTLSQGEPAYTTDTREFFMGTGSGNVNMGGSQWYTGTGMSGTSTSATYYYSGCPQVKAGDMFLNTTYGYVYQCTTAGSGTTARWTYKGCIKGATGAAGAAGIADEETIIKTICRCGLLEACTYSDAGGDVGLIYSRSLPISGYESKYLNKTVYVTAAVEPYDTIDFLGGDSRSLSKTVQTGERALIKITSPEATVLYIWK